MSFRLFVQILGVLALLALAILIIRNVFSMRRNPERDPANIREFYDDDALEGRRLERVLGTALIFVAILAVALLGYFVFEPTRQADANAAFRERSIARGAELFANKQSPNYNATASLLCADCHGANGGGGTAPFVLQPESDACLHAENKNNIAVPECLPKQVTWTAPDLTLAGLRYTKSQLNHIITYGRPGTPMPAWGVASGKGAKDAQSIDDLVNYVESIKTTPAKAQKLAADQIGQYKKDSAQLVVEKRTALSDAEAALAKAQADPTTKPAAIAALQAAVDNARQELTNAIAYDDDVQQLSDGAILFRLNCARCHTKTWSYRMNEPARTDIPPLPPQGSGAYGPNLTNGTTLLQFPGLAGSQEQFDWVAVGVPANNLYGVRGISSGRMPHFSEALTRTQIKAIVAYERSL